MVFETVTHVIGNISGSVFKKGNDILKTAYFDSNHSNLLRVQDINKLLKNYKDWYTTAAPSFSFDMHS